jgi:hypothetical protein
MQVDARQRLRQDGAGSKEPKYLAQAPSDIDIARWTEIGKEFASRHNIETWIRIGYANNTLDDGHDPWGGPCHVVALGYIGPGGPYVVAAGRPVGDDYWYPLADKGDEYLFREIVTPHDSIVLSIALDCLTLPESTYIPPGTPAFFEWLGFMLELRDGAAKSTV